MSTDGHPTKASLRELAPLFAEAAGRDGAARRHSTLRLQPTVLPPPPEESAAPAAIGASHEDDLDLGLDADDYARRRQWLLAAAGVAIAIAGGVAYLAFGPVQPQRPEAVVRPPPAVVAPPANPPPAAPVVAAPAPPPAATPAPPPVVAPVAVPPVVAAPPAAPPSPAPVAAAPADTSMGQVSDELVAPSTDGLSPPRKVNAVRIVVEGDREIRPQ